MPLSYTYSTVLSGDDLVYTLHSGDSLVVTQTGGLISPDSGAITADVGATGTSVLLMGLVWLQHIELFSHDAVTITSLGTLQSSRDDALVLGEVGGNCTLTNQGLVVSTAGFGAVTFGGANSIWNSGTIRGQSGGISMGMDYAPGDQLFNTGTIYTTFGEAVFLGGSQDTLTNHGVIQSQGGNAVRMLGDATAAGLEASFATLQNFGNITASRGIAVVSDLALAESHFNLTNSGVITGRAVAITTGASSDVITNEGIIYGNVLLHGGNDSFTSLYGRVFGTIDLGAGDDLFNGRGNPGNGSVVGGSGNDVYVTDDPGLRIVEAATPGEVDTVYAGTSFQLAANVENLILRGASGYWGIGNLGDNRITGNVSNNLLSGHDGNDTLYGMAGDDQLAADAGDDRLFGGYGRDSLTGGTGNDLLSGGDGADTLDGGFGKDMLTGGKGRDAFVWQEDHQTSPVLAATDVVSDFVQTEDTIVLGSNDPWLGIFFDQFIFIRQDLFTHRAGEVRFFYQGDTTVVTFDTDGDGLRNGAITLLGHITLQASDFDL